MTMSHWIKGAQMMESTARMSAGGRPGPIGSRLISTMSMMTMIMKGCSREGYLAVDLQVYSL